MRKLRLRGVSWPGSSLGAGGPRVQKEVSRILSLSFKASDLRDSDMMLGVCVEGESVFGDLSFPEPRASVPFPNPHFDPDYQGPAKTWHELPQLQPSSTPHKAHTPAGVRAEGLWRQRGEVSGRWDLRCTTSWACRNRSASGFPGPLAWTSTLQKCWEGNCTFIIFEFCITYLCCPYRKDLKTMKDVDTSKYWQNDREPCKETKLRGKK